MGARPLRSIVLLWLAGVLAGCASRTTVVLLPEAHGRDTAVTVTRGSGSVVLDQPYEAVREGAFGLREFQSTPEEVGSLFGPALAAQPARAATFTLYFVEGKDVLTDESRQLVETSLAEIARRPVPDVLVVGHTDLVGTHPFNDALSRQRADLIRNELVATRRRAAEHRGRGARQARPVVPTGGRRRRAAQPARRGDRALSRGRPSRASGRPSDGCQARVSARPARRRARPFQRSASSVRSSAGSAPSANAGTSACSASTTPRAVDPGAQALERHVEAPGAVQLAGFGRWLRSRRR